MNDVIHRLRQRPVRGLAAFLSLCVAGYFIWAAWTDAPKSNGAWLCFAAVQFLVAGVTLTEPRNRS